MILWFMPHDLANSYEQIKHIMQHTSPYKILLVPDRFAHYRYSIFKNISEKYFVEIYAPKAKDSSGIEVAEATTDHKSEPYKLNWIDIKSFSARGVCFWQSKVFFASLKRDYDICIYWGDAWRISTWLSAIAAKMTGKKVIFWTHGLYGNERFFKKIVRINLYKIAHQILLYGNHSKKKLVEAGFKEDKLQVINNSLDVKNQNEIYSIIEKEAAVKKNNPSQHQLIFVGRLEKNKKLNLLIENLRELNRKSDKAINLLIIGNGSEMEALKFLCKKNDVEKLVKFYGECYDQKKLAPLIAESSICISPGNVGLTAMQSLVYGTPVITHDDPFRQMPEYEAIIEGVSGALFRHDSPKSLIDSILRCIDYIENKKITPQTCRNVILEQYTPEYQLKIFNSAISQILDKEKK